MKKEADGAVNALDVALPRRRWFEHWYRPGNDTPWGYFAGRFGFLTLLVVGAPKAFVGQGWRAEPGVWVAVLLDGSWQGLVLSRKLRR